MSQLAIDEKLTVKVSDKKWTEVAKKVINAIMDYASKTNKFRTVRIGEHTEVDECPGFYITFPGLDDQDRIAFQRTENIFTFRCIITIKGSNYKECLQGLLECHGALLAKLDEDHDMAGIPNGVPEIGVAQVHNLEAFGLSTGSGARVPAQSFEYLYGLTTIRVKTTINLRG